MKVFVRVVVSSSIHIHQLRLSGRIRVGGATTSFDLNRVPNFRAGSSHRFIVRQSDPDQRRLVRQAFKDGKTPVARIRVAAIVRQGQVTIKKVPVELIPDPRAFG